MYKVKRFSKENGADVNIPTKYIARTAGGLALSGSLRKGYESRSSKMYLNSVKTVRSLRGKYAGDPLALEYIEAYAKDGLHKAKINKDLSKKNLKVSLGLAGLGVGSLIGSHYMKDKKKKNAK